jgi:hypothetical protein
VSFVPSKSLMPGILGLLQQHLPEADFADEYDLCLTAAWDPLWKLLVIGVQAG